LLNLEARFPSKETRKNKIKLYIYIRRSRLVTIGRSCNKSRAYQDFSVEARPVTRSFTQQNQQQAMEGCMGSLEQSVQTLTAENQLLMAWITEAFEMMAAHDQLNARENWHRRPRGGDGEDFQGGERPHAFGHRHVKLDFLRLNGEEDPTCWVCWAEQFFRFQGTHEEDKASLASFHLEGEAQLWFQILLREGREIGWPEFKEGVFARFGPIQFYNPFGELTKL